MKLCTVKLALRRRLREPMQDHLPPGTMVPMLVLTPMLQMVLGLALVLRQQEYHELQVVAFAHSLLMVLCRSQLLTLIRSLQS